MGTTALTATQSECQPHACHVSLAKMYWGASCSGRLRYLCSFDYKGKTGSRFTVKHFDFLFQGFRSWNIFSDAEKLIINDRFAA